MKRTLLASAFAVMALAASAQISEVTKVKGDGFDFIPKSLTTTGVITPYSTIGVEYHWGSNQIPEFTVYDASFNVEKTFKYDPMVFKSNLVPMRALADFKTKKVIKELIGGTVLMEYMVMMDLKLQLQIWMNSRLPSRS